MKICWNFRHSLFKFWWTCVQKFKGISALDSSIQINKAKKNYFFWKHLKFTFETWQHSNIVLKEQQPIKMNQSVYPVSTALSSVSFNSMCIQRHTAFAYVCVVRRIATHKSFYSQRRNLKAVTVWARLKFLVVSVWYQLP